MERKNRKSNFHSLNNSINNSFYSLNSKNSGLNTQKNKERFGRIK